MLCSGIPEVGVTVLAGAPKVGKTLLAGQRALEAGRPALLIIEEGSLAGISYRLRRQADDLGLVDPAAVGHASPSGPPGQPGERRTRARYRRRAPAGARGPGPVEPAPRGRREPPHADDPGHGCARRHRLRLRDRGPGDPPSRQAVAGTAGRYLGSLPGSIGDPFGHRRQPRHGRNAATSSIWSASSATPSPCPSTCSWIATRWCSGRSMARSRSARSTPMPCARSSSNADGSRPAKSWTQFDVKSKATALKALEDLEGIDWFDGPRNQRFYTFGTVQ